MVTAEGKVFDVLDRDMAGSYRQSLEIREIIAKGYCRAVSGEAIRGDVEFRRDSSGRIYLDNAILRRTEDVYTYKNAAGEEIRTPVWEATKARPVSRVEFAKHLQSLDLGVPVNLAVQERCQRCNGKGFTYSRVKLGHKTKCHECDGEGYHVSYPPVPVFW
jgi:hypothetical protein